MNNSLRLLLVEDDSFTRQLVSSTLRQQGFAVFDCDSAARAIELLAQHEPHVVVTDLDLGSTSASGIDLLHRINREHPWMGLVALTAHSDPNLAAEGTLPDSVVYVVKSEIEDLQSLGATIKSTLSNREVLEANASNSLNSSNPDVRNYLVSKVQAETLRMLAQGMSNKSIAEIRGTTVRAVENLVSRIYDALELDREQGRNRRIEAVRLWQSGHIRVQ